MVFTIKIDVSELQQGVENIEDVLSTAISEALDNMAEQAIEGAQSTVPVATGALRDSIESGDKTENSIEVGASVEYAPFVEFGTTRMVAQPYLGPEADRMQSEAPRILIDILKKYLS